MARIEQIPHVLACDVGNSAIRFAHVHAEQVSEPQVFRLGDLQGLGEALKRLWDEIPAPRKIAACSVNLTGLKALEAAVEETLGEDVLTVGRDLPLPIETDLPHPEGCGTDRICAATAAYDRIGRACVIGDFGSAITIDCVSDHGVFLGGAILPGLRMQTRSLHNDTAQLPDVAPEEPPGVFGRNTEEAILSGVVRGAKGALRELTEAYATNLGSWPIVLLTGTDAKLVAGELSESDMVQAIVPDLVIRGVAMAYYNALLKP